MKKILSIALVCILYICMSGDASAATINKPTNYLGLVGYWTFDGKDIIPNVRDLSGNGNHGTLNGQSATTTIIGKVGQALRLDGSDDYVNVGHSSSLALTGEALTMSMWMKYTPTGDWQTWVSKNDADGTHSAPFFLYMIGASFEDQAHFSLADPTGTGYNNTLGATTLVEGNWYHVVGVYNGTDMRIYLNGVLDNTPDARTGVLQSKTSSLRIGTNGVGAESAKGAIDDVRIYNRALNAAEVAALYNKGNSKVAKSKIAVSNGLIGYWTFDGQDMTPNVRDVSGQGNHGTLANFAATTTVPGKLGQGLQFDDVDDAVSIGSPAVLNNLTTSSYAFWLKRTTTGGRSIYYKVFLDITTNPYGFSNSIGIIEQCNSGGLNKTTAFDTVPLNEWVHVVITKDGTCDPDGTHIYLNGEESAYFYEDSGDVIATNEYAGGLGGGAGGPGIIDDFRIYNRVITEAEIKQLYNLGAGSKMSATVPGRSASNLLGHWTFDGQDMTPNVRDVSGQGNHGTLNGQSATTTAIGKIGQALQFDGDNDYVDLGTNLGPQVLNGSNFSVSLWFNSRNITDTDDRQIFFGNNAGISARQIALSWQTMGKVSIGEEGVMYIATTDESFSANTWYHVVWTYNNGAHILYIDGVSSETANYTFSDSYSSSYEIGESSFGFTMDGSIDDVRVYNKTLTASEVQSLYNMGR